MVAKRMGSRRGGNDSNGENQGQNQIQTQDTKSNPLARQGSLYSLTIDEVQNQLGDLGKPLSSMNLDELLKMAWQDILQGQNRSSLDRNATLGTMTLEDFLVKAGVVPVSSSSMKNSDSILEGVDSMGLPQQAQWMNFQIPSINPQQQQQQQKKQQQQSRLPNFMPGPPVQQSIPIVANPVMDASYSESQITMSPSPLMGTLSDTQSPGRKRVAPGDIVEKTVERWQKRMIKNRESTARSRARKQAYTHELENKVSRLEEENERLKRRKEWEKVLPSIPPPEPSQEMKRKYSRNEQVHCDHSSINSVMNIGETEQSNIGAGAGNSNEEVTTNKTKAGRTKTGFHIHHGNLKPHFGKRLQDAARELGVSKSTIKRACRKCGIERWPSSEQNKRNPSLFLKENAVNQVQAGDAETSISSGSNIPPLDLALHQNRPHHNTEGIQQLANLCPEDGVVILKAKFKDDTVKIQLRLPSGMEKLMEEVSKRLNLKIGIFKLKYLDKDDDDWILLTCDDDLHLCLKTLTALGKTTIQLSVQLLSS